MKEFFSEFSRNDLKDMIIDVIGAAIIFITIWAALVIDCSMVAK